MRAGPATGGLDGGANSLTVPHRAHRGRSGKFLQEQSGQRLLLRQRNRFRPTFLRRLKQREHHNPSDDEEQNNRNDDGDIHLRRALLEIYRRRWIVFIEAHGKRCRSEA